MDVLVKRAPHVVHHPLADAGGEILFGVGADRAYNGDHRHCQHGKIQHRKFVLPRHLAYDPGEPGRQGFGLQQVVDDDFERPGLSQIGHGFTDHRQQSQA